LKKAYIYPLSSRDKTLGLYNPYIDDLIRSFSNFTRFENYDNPAKTGILDIFRYIKQIDYIFFNWIEKLPENKGGKIQTLILFIILHLLKFRKVKIVWTMHNKLSHTIDHAYWKKLVFRKMLKNSDIILTHSVEGVKYGEHMVKGSGRKIHYFPHPVKDRRPEKNQEKEYDLLIWGTISPYKGIDKFLEYVYKNGLEKKYKILIAGKITSDVYAKKLETYKSKNILVENKFIEDAMLRELISKSKLVLFTYSQSSILSSGVLMDSLGYGANIIGPDVGAFTDLANEGIISTYFDFHDMFKKIDDQLNDTGKRIPKEITDKFLEDNSWNKFAEKISLLLNSVI